MGSGIETSKHPRIPGHQNIVSCRPLGPSHTDVIMEHSLVPRYFETAVSVRSPMHAFLLKASAKGAPSSRQWLRVAAVERGQDSTMDALLQGARACPVLMLFSAALPDTWQGVNHVFREDQYCHMRVK